MENVDNVFDSDKVKELTKKLIKEVEDLKLDSVFDTIRYDILADDIKTTDMQIGYMWIELVEDKDLDEVIQDIKNGLMEKLECSELVFNKLFIMEKLSDNKLKIWKKYVE